MIEDLGRGDPLIIVPVGSAAGTSVKIVKLGQYSKLDLRKHTQESGGVTADLDDSTLILQIREILRQASNDRFTTLAREQPLVRAGKVSLDRMRQHLDVYRDNTTRPILAELMDVKPSLRIPSATLPRSRGGAVLYRGPWQVRNGLVDPSALRSDELIPIDLDANPKAIITTILGKPVIGARIEDSPRRPSFYRKAPDGLYTLRWVKGKLSFGNIPSTKAGEQYVVLSSNASAEEIVDSYVPSLGDKLEAINNFLRGKGLRPTPLLTRNLLAKVELGLAAWEREVNLWNEIITETESGEFSLDDPLQVDLEFARSSPRVFKGYKGFKQLVVTYQDQDPPITPPALLNLSISERQAVAYSALESVALLDFLLRVQSRADVINHRLVIVQNMSNGYYLFGPIRQHIENRADIVETYIHSGSGDTQSQLPKLLGPVIDQDIIMAIVEGTVSIATLGSNPRSFRSFLDYLIKNTMEKPLSITHWNPDDKEVTYPKLGTQHVVDIDRITGRTAILTVGNMSNENMPDWLRDQVSLYNREQQVSHKPCSFDDWSKANTPVSPAPYFNRFGLQATSLDYKAELVAEIGQVVRMYLRDGRVLRQFPKLNQI